MVTIHPTWRGTWRACLAVLTCSLITTAGFATPIMFDPDGSNPTDSAVSTSVLDFLPGNTLLKGIGDIVTPRSNQPLTYYLQTKLGRVKNNLNQVVTNNHLDIDYEITLIMGRSALANLSATADGTTTILKEDASPAVNYFRLYYDTNKNASDLLGSGFDDTSLPTTLPILSGTISKLSGSVNYSGDSDSFDTYGPDYPGLNTYLTFGGLSLKVNVSSVDSTFFPNGIGTLLNQFNVVSGNGSATTPFDTVDPSKKFANGVSPFAPITPNLGSFNGNGSGPDFQLQNDINSTFVVDTGIFAPEPSSWALGLCGLAGLCLTARRRHAKVASHEQLEEAIEIL